MSVKRDAALLYVIQACGYLVPLIALPYLSRTLGPDRFGQVSFAVAFMQFFITVTDFGFDLTAARKISIHRGDREMLTRLYWIVTISKGLIALLCAVIVIASVEFVPALHDDRGVILISLLSLAGTVLSPVWLYQGLEKMPMMAVITLATRIVSLTALFFIVKSSADYLATAVCFFAPLLASGLILTAIAHGTGMLTSWQKITRKDLWEQSVEAFHVFSGSAFAFMYTYLNAIILKFLTGNDAVGFYVMADKIVSPIKQFFGPLIQTMFPRICKLHAENRGKEADHIVRKVVLTVLLLNVCAILVVFVGGEKLVVLAFGDKFLPAVPVLKALIFLPAVVGIASVLMQLGLIAQGEVRPLKRIYGVAAAFHFVQSIILVKEFGATGTAVSVVLTEVLVIALICYERRGARSRRIAAGAQGAQ
ncbi:flippase [Paraburkholderia rhizosphaerae]|uniref:PST family polysaccharide transporter n=1 Tax=Paraburkholderia rhizosphaerae TaxID=480658 RepID=A0A4R8LHZ7_9BURK|nr:flippase [Paraburkholderia rhizosphaerae]TDY42906.1 PST family polysaccharide transporter [Paraburkholderia rhizosphaerae]